MFLKFVKNVIYECFLKVILGFNYYRNPLGNLLFSNFSIEKLSCFSLLISRNFSLLKFKDYTKNFKHISRQHNPEFLAYLEQKVLNESVEEDLPEMKKTVTKRL